MVEGSALLTDALLLKVTMCLLMVIAHLLEAKDMFWGQGYSQKCTYCNQTNHIVDPCLELHEKPSRPLQAAHLVHSAGLSSVISSLSTA